MGLPDKLFLGNNRVLTAVGIIAHGYIVGQMVLRRLCFGLKVEMLRLKSADMEDEVDCGWIRENREKRSAACFFLSRNG